MNIMASVPVLNVAADKDVAIISEYRTTNLRVPKDVRILPYFPGAVD
jgi:hypothetical protein